MPFEITGRRHLLTAGTVGSHFSPFQVHSATAEIGRPKRFHLQPIGFEGLSEKLSQPKLGVLIHMQI
jgi:hypothetical protein